MKQTDDNRKWHEDDPERQGRGFVRMCPHCHQTTPLAADNCSSCGKPFVPPTDATADE